MNRHDCIYLSKISFVCAGDLGEKLANVLQRGHVAVGNRHARGAAVLEQLDQVQLEGQLQLLDGGDAAGVSRLVVVVRPQWPKNIRLANQSGVGDRTAGRQEGRNEDCIHMKLVAVTGKTPSSNFYLTDRNCSDRYIFACEVCWCTLIHEKKFESIFRQQ